jgi:hypothetical protein
MITVAAISGNLAGKGGFHARRQAKAKTGVAEELARRDIPLA